MKLSKVIKRLEEIQLTRGDIEIISVRGIQGTLKEPMDIIWFDTEKNELVFNNDLPF